MRRSAVGAWTSRGLGFRSCGRTGGFLQAGGRLQAPHPKTLVKLRHSPVTRLPHAERKPGAMIQAREMNTRVDTVDAKALLEDTRKAVKVMKASWLRVALNLQKIRANELWRFSQPKCGTFDEYMYGVLKLNRGVARRMLEAVDYTEMRRPQLLQEFQSGKEDVHIPSYDVLDQLRRAQGRFEGREEEFAEIESLVYDDGVGRVTLGREIKERLRDEDAAGEGPSETSGEKGPSDLAGIIAQLKSIEADLLQLDVPKDAKRMLFQLVELLDKEQTKRAAGDEIESE